MLAYTANIDTANGRTRAAPVRLDRIAIGGLVERSVEALVAQPGQLKTSLLGMSFLNRLQSWEVRGDRLLLRRLPLEHDPLTQPAGAPHKKLNRKRTDTSKRNPPNPISSIRRGSRCAKCAP